MLEVDNVLRILKEAKIAIDKDDNVELKELSNQTIHTASTTQDPDNIAVAVIVYSLSKIMERPEYRSYQGWNKFYTRIIKAINSTIMYLETGKQEKARRSLNKIRHAIGELSGNLKKYIQDVFQKASINKASKI